MATSAAGREFITSWEGERLSAYRDSAGIWTIGVGHTGHDVHSTLAITRQRSQELLRQDLHETEEEISDLVKVPLYQYEFDALVAWHFNTGGLRGSTLLKKLNRGQYDQVDEEMLRWNKFTNPKTGKKEPLRGLTLRRRSEADLWNHGDYVPRNEDDVSYIQSNVVPAQPALKSIEKPMADRPAVKATAAVSLMGVLSEATGHLEPLIAYSGTIRWIFVGLTVLSVGYAIFASHKESEE